MSRRLLDVNVLIALFDSAHLHHDAAHRWFEKKGAAAWATCPLTENGFVRVVSHSRYPTGGITPSEALRRLKEFSSGHRGHEFWPDSVSLCDNRLFDSNFIIGANDITDIYLLGLAAKKSGRLATFDRRLKSSAIRNAPDNIVELIPGIS